MAGSSFNNPFLLGFDNLEQILNRIAKSSESFPPYNIEQIDENVLRLSLAVAGYTEDDLEITLEDNQLIIRGRQAQNPNRQFLHRGIAGRAFIKSFVLADNMQVGNAFVEWGLLNIDLLRPQRQSRVKKISIQKKKGDKTLIASCVVKK